MATQTDEITADTTFTKAQAVKVTDTSPVKFANAALLTKLAELGANLEGTGKEWAIKASHLVEVGLLTDDFQAYPRANRSRDGKTSTSRQRGISTKQAEDKLARAEAKVTGLNEELDKATERIKQRLAAANAEVKAAKRAVEASKKAEAEFLTKQLEEIEESERINAEKKAALLAKLGR